MHLVSLFALSWRVQSGQSLALLWLVSTELYTIISVSTVKNCEWYQNIYF